MLKKAKKIANGKGDANLSLGAFVDTLVVHPDDLVQVIAKVGLFQWYNTKHCLITGVHDILSFFARVSHYPFLVELLIAIWWLPVDP